ncbi:insulinase family protein [Gilvimarinus agarilyticus]|uniref:insulinase family protein n=1 Tax=Gilvimarinus agarilyticus TaxID=679259 RepID=UPI0005A08376|nr:insulinase family protein [Gilvimarinus agarilyticus]
MPGVCNRFKGALTSLALLLTFLAAPLWAETSNQGFRVDEVIKSPEDVREYRALAYDNGVQVLLVSDPAAIEAEWTLSVLAGGNQDPAALPGLNRLLTLVLSGDSPIVATIYPEHAEYHMRTAGTEWSSALSGFVRQVVGRAEFSVEAIEQAQHVLANKMRTGLGATLTDRRDDVYSALFNAEHPMARRQGGSASIAPLPAVAPALKKNYQRFYTPERIRLALVANMPLAQQQALVSKALESLGASAADHAQATEYPPLFKPEDLPLQVQIQADTSKPQLQLLFPVPNPLALYADKPLAEVSRLLADGGPGSLLALLQSLGWADAIDTGMGMQSRYDGLYEVRVDLTELGVRARDQVVALVFYMIEQIRVRGLRSWRHQELARAAALDFRYRDATAIRDSAQLAHALHYYRPRDVLFGPYRFNDFNERLVRRYLDFLRSDNVLISLTSAAQVTGEQLSPELLTPYSVAAASEMQPEIKVTVRRQLDFPEPNNFLPTRLSSKEPPMLPSSQKADINELVELFSRPRFRAWFSRGQVTSPVASVLLRLEIPAAGGPATHAAATELMTELIRQELSEKAFAAHLAGVDFSVDSHALGVDIIVHGYNTQLGLMLTRIGQLVDDVELDERRFKRAKRILSERLSRGPSTVEGVLGEQVAALHYRPGRTRSERLAALSGITLEQLKDFNHSHYRVAALNVLFYGNLYRQEAQRLAALSEHYLLHDKAKAPPASLYGRLKADAGANFSSDKLDGSALYLQGQGATAADYAEVMLAAQLMRDSAARARESAFAEAAEPAFDVPVVPLAEPIAGTEAAPESEPLAAGAEAELDQGQITVFDWVLAGRPALVVYAPGAEVTPHALRAFVAAELAHSRANTNLEVAKTVVKQRLASDHNAGRREQSLALWRELLDSRVTNEAVTAALNKATAAESHMYRVALARQVPGALVLMQRGDGSNTSSEDQQARSEYWGHLRSTPLKGPVLP